MGENSRVLSGARIIIEVLKEQGVDTIFGYPGGTVISVYDELYKNGEGIRHILTSHEQGAAHAADGYARSTGKVGVCLVTSGPGATNLVTGIATAYMDSVPLVAITINVSTDSLGKDSFQEVDIAGVVMPVTKHGFIVKDVKHLAETLRRAFAIASDKRPGPVLVDITCDVTKAYAEYSEIDRENVVCNSGNILKAKRILNEESISLAINLLKKAKKPLLMIGGGAVISRASEQINEFVENFGCPVTDTLMGKGVFDGIRNEYIGMCGIFGTSEARYAINNCDLLIAAGTRFSERVTENVSDFAPKAKILHIDIDKAELNKNVRADLGIQSDIKKAFDMINREFKKKYDRTAWIEEIKTNSGADDMKNVKTDFDCQLTGPSIVRTIYESVKGKAIICTEVGQNQMLAANNYYYSFPGQLLTSGGLGTMGFGLGAAIGAKIGNPDRIVINIAGDGCFRMNMNELMTASRYSLPVIEVIIDNHALGMVHQMQAADFEGRFSQTEFADNPDYAALSIAMGAEAQKVSDSVQLKKVLLDALNTASAKNGKPIVIICTISKDETV